MERASSRPLLNICPASWTGSSGYSSGIIAKECSKLYEVRHSVLIDGVTSKRNAARFPREDRNARRYKSQVGSSALPSADHKSMTVQLNVKWLLADGRRSSKGRKDRKRKTRRKMRPRSVFETGCRQCCLPRGVSCFRPFSLNDSSYRGCSLRSFGHRYV